jgi:hypothetical protein
MQIGDTAVRNDQQFVIVVIAVGLIDFEQLLLAAAFVGQRNFPIHHVPLGATGACRVQFLYRHFSSAIRIRLRFGQAPDWIQAGTQGFGRFEDV